MVLYRQDVFVRSERFPPFLKKLPLPYFSLEIRASYHLDNVGMMPKSGCEEMVMLNGKKEMEFLFGIPWNILKRLKGGDSPGFRVSERG